MDLTLTAITAAVVTACFITAGAKDEAPVFPTHDVESQAVVSVYTPEEVEVENTLHTLLTTGYVSVYTPEEVEVEDISHTLSTNEYLSVYIKNTTTDTLTNSMNSYGVLLIGKIEQVKYKVNTVQSAVEASVISKHTQLSGLLETASSTANISATQGTYVFSLLDAYFKHPSSTYPHYVTGWYNKTLVFGSYLNIYTSNIKENVTSTLTIGVHFLSSISPRTERLITTAGMGAFAKTVNQRDLNHQAITTAFVVTPSNINPYRTTDLHVEELESELVVSVPDTRDLKPTGLLNTIGTTLENMDYFMINGVKAVHTASSVLGNTSVVYGQDIQTSEYFANEATTEFVTGTMVSRNTEGLVTCDSNYNLTLYIKELESTEHLNSVASAGTTSVFFISPYDVEEDIDSDGELTLYIKDATVDEALNTVESNGQSDMVHGSIKQFSRTEDVHTTLGAIRLLMTPGLGDPVGNTVSSTVFVTPVYGADTEITDAVNTLTTSNVINFLIERMVTPDNTETLVSASALTTYIKDTEATSNLNTLNSLIYAEILNSRAALGVHDLIIDFGASPVVKDSTASLLNHTVNTGHVSSVDYEDPREVSGGDTVQTSVELSTFAVGPVEAVHTVTNNLNNIQIRVKDMEEDVEESLITSHGIGVYVNRATHNIEQTVTSMNVTGIVPSKIAYVENETITDFLMSTHYEDNVASPLTSSLLSSLGNILLADGLRAQVTETIHTTQTGYGVQLTVDRVDTSSLNNTETNLGSLMFVVGADKVSTEGVYDVSTTLFITLYKDMMFDGTVQTVATECITTLHVKDATIDEALNTVESSGQSDMVHGSIKQFSRTEDIHTTLGDVHLLMTPGLGDPVGNTVSSTVFATPVYGADTEITDAVNTLTTLSNILFEQGLVIDNTLDTINTTAVCDVMVEDIPLTDVLNTVTTTLVTNVYVKHATAEALLNTASMALGGMQLDVVHPVTITLNKQTGTGGTNSIITVAGFSITPSSVVTPTRAHYTFNGYYTLPSGGVQIVNNVGIYVALTSSTYTSDVTLYAQWAAVLYTITWKSYTNVTLKEEQLVAGSTSTAPTGTTDTAQYDYAWPKASTSVTGNETITETRTTKSYTITWKAYSGATLKSETLLYGATSTAPTGTTDTDQYDYAWPKSSTTVVGTENITETRTTKSYTITWYKYGQSGETYTKRETLLYGATSTAPTTGTTDTAQYQYDWPKASTTVTGTENITETRTLLSYTITWYKYGQSGETYAKRETLTYGSNSSAPTGTADTTQYDYSWPKASTTVVGTESITETRVVKSYTITWKSYANVTLKTETLAYGSASTAPLGTSDTSSYDYSWPKASTTVVGAETITETRVGQTYTVTFNANDGGTPSPTYKSVVFGDTYGTLATVTRTNWAFLGWHHTDANSNLVRNGKLEFNNNDNFNGTGYSISENAFYHTSGSSQVQMNDYIEIWGNGLDSFDRYTLSAEHKQATPVVAYSRYYFMVMCYDVNYRFIANQDVNFRANTQTYLTQALTSGQTVVHLNDLTNWYDDGTQNYNHAKGLAMWHPTLDSSPYDTYKYTRRWREVKGVDKVNKTLTLNAPYSGDTMPIGSPAQNHQSGGSYSYFGASNALMTGDWVTNSGTSSATPNVNEMRYGTKYVRVAWLINRNAGIETSYIRNITFKNITNPRQQRLITSSSLVVVPASHTVNARWNPTIASGLLNTLTTSGQSDIRFGYTLQISRTETLSTAAIVSLENQTAFNITLNANGGVNGTPTSITGLTSINITPSSITPATRTNYTLTGYWTATSGGTKYINADGTYNNLNSNTFVGAVTLYAQWTINNVYFDYNPYPTTIGLLADISIGGVLQSNDVSDWYQTRAANSTFKVHGLTIPPGWNYSSYTTTRLVNVTVGGSGATTEIQGDGDMTQTAARAIAITVTASTYSVTVNQNGGAGSSASVSTYQPKTSSTVITMTRGTRTNYRFSHWSVSGANNLATVNNNTITIPAYTTTVQPYGALTITANWLTAVASGLNTLTSALGDMQHTVATPFTITLNQQSGSGGTASITCVNGFYLDPTSITIPTRAGYTFNGYYTATSGGTQRINSSGTYVALTNTTYTAATTLYAQWSLTTYTLTMDVNGGTGGTASAVYNITTSSTIATLLGSPTKVGYTLSGWKWTSTTAGGWTNGTTYATSQNVSGKYATGTLQAQWTPNSFVITLSANGGTVATNNEISVVYNTSIEAFNINMLPTRTGYTFTGYWTATSGGTMRIGPSSYNALYNNTYSSATTLYAQWSPITYTLTMNVNGGSGGTASATYNITTSSTIATLLGSPTKVGHTLSGWKWTSTTAGGWTNGTTYATSHNVSGKYATGTLQAQWTINEYTVTWKDWDGTTLKTEYVEYGNAATPPTQPTRTAYAFSAWSVSYASITANTTITAVYVKAPLNPTITYSSKTSSSITFTLKSNSPYDERIYYEVTDNTPDANYVDLTAGASISASVTGLSSNTSYSVYAQAYVFDGVARYSGVVSITQTTLYNYAFTDYSTWTNDASCSPTTPFTCNESTYNWTQTECQCLWGAWSSWSSTSSASQSYPACGQGAVQRQVQKTTRTCATDYTTYHYDCNPYNCNPYNCNPYDCNPYDCNPYNCNCTCTWTRNGLGYFSSTDISYTDGCSSKTECQYKFGKYTCTDYVGNNVCDTCYQTCYQTCYNTCYQTCYESCLGYNYFCSCDSWALWSNVSSCSQVVVSGGDCNGQVTTRCQTRTSTGYTQSRVRTCSRS